MNILDALFGSTELLKQKTRNQIMMWLIPLKVLEYLVGPVLSIFLIIQTYMREVPRESNVEATAYILSAFLVFGLYSRLIKWLKDWQTNKRIKWFLLTLVRLMPIAIIAILVNVMAADFNVFVITIERVIYAYLASYFVGYFGNPLVEELKVRDKIRLNTENGRIVD
jgi:hypothetical protein